MIFNDILSKKTNTQNWFKNPPDFKRKTNTIWYHLYVKSLDKFRLTDTEHRFMAAKGEWQGRDGVGVWD